jgi:hypothetical protein
MATAPIPLNQTTPDSTASIDTKPDDRGQEEQDRTTGDGKDETGEETNFHSSYNEFVSEQMKHYTDEERRSGKALKEIGRKWRERKDG